MLDRWQRHAPQSPSSKQRACYDDDRVFAVNHHVTTPTTARECTALTHTSFSRLEVDMRYARGGRGPGRCGRWSVIRERPRRRLVRTSKRNTAARYISCRSPRHGICVGESPETWERWSSLPASARDSGSRCWHSGVGSCDDSRPFPRVHWIALGAGTYLHSGLTFSEPPVRQRLTTTKQQQQKQKCF